MKCHTCPFNDNPEAIEAQNLGCLPDPHYMVKTLDELNIALSCHDRQSEACHGLSEVRDTSNAKILPYSRWIRKGLNNE